MNHKGLEVKFKSMVVTILNKRNSHLSWIKLKLACNNENVMNLCEIIWLLVEWPW